MSAIRSAVDLAVQKTLRLDLRWNAGGSAPVFTAGGRYTARSWTQWTQGFQYGNALLCFELSGDRELLEVARRHVAADMAEHLTHTGVHDHGFNNISTYGNLRRLMLAGRIERNEWELRFYELALKVSGAVQAARWTSLKDGLGYIHSFNGATRCSSTPCERCVCAAWRTCWAMPCWASRMSGSTCCRACCSMRKLRRSTISTTAKGATTTTRLSCAAAQRMRQSLIPRAARFAARHRNRATRPSARGRVGWRGRCWALPRSLSLCRSLPASEFGVEGVPEKADACAMLRASCEGNMRFLSAPGERAGRDLLLGYGSAGVGADGRLAGTKRRSF